MKIIAALVFLMSSVASANFAPQNTMQIPVKNPPSVKSSGVSEKAFNEVITKILNVYKPIVAQEGGNLSIKRLWKDPTVNSNTFQDGSNWVVNAFGGLARYPSMTADGYMMVLCHEIGHHMGGYPKSNLNTWGNNLTNHWASNEGQSDYFAALKCFRRMVMEDNNEFFQTCSTGRAAVCCDKTPQESGICSRTIDGGIVLASVLHDLAGSGEPFKLSLETPDLTKVKKMDDSHPNAQSRLDTYYAGAICGADLNVPFSNNNPIPGACSEEAGDAFGFRPRSWYKPNFNARKHH